ncbi:MAG: YCF48-related protein [Gemmatimonadales bacterium]
MLLLMVMQAPLRGALGDRNLAFSFETIHAGTLHDALYDIRSAGSRILAVGEHGLILESADGGVTWRTRKAPTELALLGADAVEEQSTVVVGQQGVIMRAADGQDNWTSATLEAGPRLFAVAFGRSGFGAAVGEFGALLVSRDGGLTWERPVLEWQRLAALVQEPHLYDVSITPGGEVLAVGEFGLVLRGQEGGTRWSVQRTGTRSLFALHRSHSGDYWGVGQEGLVVRSRNAGESWEVQPFDTAETLIDIGTDANGIDLILGEHRVYYRADTHGAWRALQDGIASRRYYALEVGKDGSVYLAGAGAILQRMQISDPKVVSR